MVRTVGLHQKKAALWMVAVFVAALFAVAIAFGSPGQAVAAQSSSQDSTQLVAAQADGVSQSNAAYSKALANVGVSTRAYVYKKGWMKWVKAGTTAGTRTKKSLRSVRIKLTGLNSGVTGSIRYKVYDKGSGWSSTKANGKMAGSKSKSVQAIKIWLAGKVASHYDVLYRVYIKGKGWQPWVKNNIRAGIIGKKYYISGYQIKLSPKTAESAGTASQVGVRYEARTTSSGWQLWRKSGATAGIAKKGRVMDGFVMRLNDAGIGGSVKYRAYIQGKKWSQGWKTAGNAVGVSNKRIEALKIQLTGAIANKYDIYYRTYVSGYGWLGWAKNGGVSGSTGLNMAVAAIQVKMVKKGDAGPSAGSGTTVNECRKTLNGIDIASWQSDLNISKVSADFVIVKATGGKGYKNPYFKAQAYATVKSGKLLGIYHFARDVGYEGSAVQEADHFVKAVGSYAGSAVLVLDWEANALLLGPSWAKKFLDRVYQKTGVRPLIYMSKSPTREYNWSSVAKYYKLWVAQYPDYLPTGYQSNPWTDSYGYGAWSAPTIFQYTSSGVLSGYSGYLDLNIFYGTKSDWKKLAAKS